MKPPKKTYPWRRSVVCCPNAKPICDCRHKSPHRKTQHCWKVAIANFPGVTHCAKSVELPLTYVYCERAIE